MEKSDVLARMFDAAPLLRFSVYTHGQVVALNEVGNEIIELLEKSMLGHEVNARAFQRAYNLFWLWVLGAFEVTRTMCQGQRCFSASFARRVRDLKRRLALLRIPFAKQELPGKGKHFSGEASVAGLNTRFKDIRFHVNNHTVSAKQVIRSFRSTMESVRPADVLGGINA